MKLAEKKTGIKIDRSAKQLQRYLDDRAVAVALSSFSSAETSSRKFAVVLDFCSNAARRIFSEFDIATLHSFERFSSASLNNIPGVGKTKLMEVELLKRLFLGRERSSSAEYDHDGGLYSDGVPSVYLQTALSVRTRNILSQMEVPLTTDALLSLDLPTVRRQKGAGKKVLSELQTARAHLLQCKVDESGTMRGTETPIRNAHTHLPPDSISALSQRTINALTAMDVSLTPAGICSLDIEAVSNRRGMGNVAVSELLKLQRDCLTGDVWRNAHAPPASFSSLSDYILGALPPQYGDSPNWKIVLNDYMGLLNSKSKLSLREVGDRLGITRERVRQMSNKVILKFFSGAAGSRFAPMKVFVANFFQAHNWIATESQLVETVDREFGWTGTTALSIASVMCCMGCNVEINEDGFCICNFKVHLGDKYSAFLEYVNHYDGLISGLGYEGMAESGKSSQLASLTEDEYLVFIRKALTSYAHCIRKKDSGKRQNRYLTDIRSLRAKQFFASEFGLNAGGRRMRNQTPMRYEAVLNALKKAGYKGLTLDELFDTVSTDAPGCRWTKDALRGLIANPNAILDDKGTKILSYSRGSVAGVKSQFSLTSFFNDDKTRKILAKAGNDIRAYMERTGFGVVSVWKIMRKYEAELRLPLPKLGFYMMMRELNAGGLEYPRYPRIAFPGMDNCKKAFQWELYEYFTYCGRKSATFFECISFFVDCLGLQPSIAASDAFPGLGLAKNADEISSPYELKRPTDRAKAPRVLLGTVKRDPDLTLLAKPGKHAIASCYFDDDGRATTMVAYVRLFFRDFENTGHPLPKDDIACLTDAGWCRKNLKFHHAVLREAHEGAPTVPGYWKEIFRFGDRLFFISDGWTVKSKFHFDKWATRIAALSSMAFTPYELGVAQTVE